MSMMRLLGLGLLGAGLIAACSSSDASEDDTRAKADADAGVVGSGSGTASDAGGSSSGSPGASSSGSPSDPNRCETSASCPVPVCECESGELVSVSAACIDERGACDPQRSCALACGGAVNDYAELDACRSESDCDVVDSSVCPRLIGAELRGQCVAGACDYSPNAICTAAGGGLYPYTCNSSDSCGFQRCPCGDDTVQIALGECQDDRCVSWAWLCGSACSGHGGYQPPEEGPEEPDDLKQPGEACTRGNECVPFDCGCNDGSSFEEFQACISSTCPSKRDACSLACFSSGGWDGQ